MKVVTLEMIQPQVNRYHVIKNSQVVEDYKHRSARHQIQYRSDMAAGLEY